MPFTVTEAWPEPSLSTSDWYHPKPNPLKGLAPSGEFSTRKRSKPVFGGSPSAVSVIVSLGASVGNLLSILMLAVACWMAGQANGLPASSPGLTPSPNVQVAALHGPAGMGVLVGGTGVSVAGGTAG